MMGSLFCFQMISKDSSILDWGFWSLDCLNFRLRSLDWGLLILDLEIGEFG